MANAKSKKVMDVAKPGEGEQSIGAKPMIIGHAPAVDPMVKNDADVEGEKVDVKPVQPPSKTRKVISPLSDNSGSAESEKGNNADEQDNDPSEGDKIVVKSQSAADFKESSSAEKTSLETEESSEKIQTEVPLDKKEASNQSHPDQLEQTEIAEADENVRINETSEGSLKTKSSVDELIESKKYFVTVHKPSSNISLADETRWFFITLVVGLIAMVALIDAGVLDLGVTLPFDFL